jgi:chromosome segregation ATPase
MGMVCLALCFSWCFLFITFSARLQLAMNHLQKKIAHLDDENHTSRKRMKDLEHELDVCRQDVERQRKLVAQREDLLVGQQRMEVAGSRTKGKARAMEDARAGQERYKQSVEEKKGSLLSPVSSLRLDAKPKSQL